MPQAQSLARLTVLVAGIALPAYCQAGAQSPAAGDAIVVRLVHPDRQAAAVLKLFEGARVAHPAAALVGWKRATRDPDQLGKPLEATIAMFNPETAQEWRVLHGAELRLDVGATDGKTHWYAVVPRDDGTIAAAVTAIMMTDGAADGSLSRDGKEITVERLGPAGAMVSARTNDMLIFGASRDDLVRGLSHVGAVSRSVSGDGARPQVEPNSTIPSLGNRVDSGLVFDLDPGRLNAGVGTTNYRRFVALLQGLGAWRISGSVALKDDQLALEVTSLLTRAGPSKPVPAPKPAVVDRSWLTWVPARDVMGVISLAFEPGATFWDSAFAVADRIDRADPSRPDVAPLRTRINLLSRAAGARLEVDLWPHLRGVTACVMADPNQPGLPKGALVVLHTDADASAERLTNDVLPRVSVLLTGKKPGGEPLRKAAPGQPAGDAPAGVASQLGTFGGRSLLVLSRGRDVVIAWGDDVMSASGEAAARPERSVAPLCTDWAREGKNAPQRLAAVWPARAWSLNRAVDTTTPAWQALAQDPPAVWWGWTGPDEARDSIHYSGLRRRVHQFLEQLPLDPSPLR